MRKAAKSFLFLLILGLIFYVAAMAYAYVQNYRLLKGNPQHEVTFYMISHQWHAGLILPRRAVENSIGALPFSSSQWLEVGWGDKEYYMNDGFSAMGALKALSRPSDGIMHIVAIDDEMLQNLRLSYNVKEYKIATSDFQYMLDFLQESFSEKGIKTPLAPSLYGEGAFFASPLTYHFFYTCNSWIAEMMKKAGYKSFPLISQHPVTLNMQLPAMP